jgi:hypothetical protein
MPTFSLQASADSQQETVVQREKTFFCQLFSMLALAGFLSMGTASLLVPAAIAADATPVSQSVKGSKDGQPMGDRNLPPAFANRLRQDLSQRTGIPPGKLRVIEASRKTWSDGCLGLGRPEESCLQALVEGWRVVLSDGSRRWVYRTDERVRVYRLEPEANQSSSLPAPVRRAVLQAASRRTGLTASQFQLVRVEQITVDGCLNLPDRNEACIEIAQQAWRVVVQAGQQRLVYHASANGSQVRLDQAASQIGDRFQPGQIPTSQLPPALEGGAVFRTIASGGFMGQTYQTVLLNDGRVIRMQIHANGATSNPEPIRRISQQEMRQFRQLLDALKQFDRLDYPALPGSADFITVTLSSRSSTVRYSDSVYNQLPQALQQIVETWTRLAHNS